MRKIDQACHCDVFTGLTYSPALRRWVCGGCGLPVQPEDDGFITIAPRATVTAAGAQGLGRLVKAFE